jgi:hypothetical protein
MEKGKIVKRKMSNVVAVVQQHTECFGKIINREIVPLSNGMNVL